MESRTTLVDGKSLDESTYSGMAIDSVINKGMVKLQVWDTAGEERFQSLTRMYYKDAHAILIGFSLTDAESFENLEKWMKDIENNA